PARRTLVVSATARGGDPRARQRRPEDATRCRRTRGRPARPACGDRRRTGRGSHGAGARARSGGGHRPGRSPTRAAAGRARPLRRVPGLNGPLRLRAMSHPKKIGFLSFGAWHPTGGMTNSAGEALRQTVELAVAAEELGIDGAFVRVHHFSRHLSAPFPLLSAIGVRTSRIEIGTGVIDMRYENPLYMAEEAAVADLLAGGRLQLGVSRGSPEPAYRGAEAFGYTV